MTQSTSPYERVVLKLSGEILMGAKEFGIDSAILDGLASQICEVVDLGVEISVVIGGGNLFRGKTLSQAGLGRVTGDHMGMLATVMNGLALRDALERVNLPARIMSAIPMMGVVDTYNRRKAMTHLQNKRAVIFCAGIGNPFFTTDTTACLRAIEIDADIVLKGTKVDGVYAEDPKINPEAEHYSKISFDEVLHRDLAVMDSTAICMCRDHNMPICVFDIMKPHRLRQAVLGERCGTMVGSKGE